MNDCFTQNALSYGKQGKEWLNTIPSIITRYAEKWTLKVFPPYNLSYNYVAPAVRADGTSSVLKIGFPKDKEFQTEIQALSVFQGEGVVQLLESDAENSVILLEQVMPGEPLSGLVSDDDATIILAKVMQKIWKPLSSQHPFVSINTWSMAIPNLKRKSNRVANRIPKHLLDNAENLFQMLISTSSKPMLLHGDLHHDNVLSSSRAGWLAIDPKGIAAEPAYEVAAMIRNPYEKLMNISNLQPLLRRRIEILSAELQINPSRLHKWCLAQTVLSAVWNVESSKGPEHAIRVAEVLNKMKFE